MTAFQYAASALTVFCVFQSASRVSATGHDECGAICEQVKSCRNDPERRGSSCQVIQKFSACSGLFFVDSSKSHVCFSPNDKACKQAVPVPCDGKKPKTVLKTVLERSRVQRVNCQRLCDSIHSCASDPGHHGSYCKVWQNPPVCFGIYFRDSSRSHVCFSPNDLSCPEASPVPCGHHHNGHSPRSTTYRSTLRTTRSTRTTTTTSTTPSVSSSASSSVSSTLSTSTGTPTSTTVVPLACDNPNFTVGPGGDFATLQLALASPAVITGSVIEVFDGTYLQAAPIVVTKSVMICGQSRTGTIFTTAGTAADPLSVLSIQADNVALVRMTIRQLNTAGTTVGTAVVVSGPGFPQTRVSGFWLDNVQVDYTEIGVSLRGTSWIVQDSSMNYVGTGGNRYGITIYGVGGTSRITNTIFANNASAGRLRAVYLTSTTGVNPNENNSGVLTLSFNSQSGPLQEFFVQDNFQGGFGALTLRFLNNVFSETATWAAAFTVSNFAGNLYGQIVLLSNTASGAGGKGLFTIDGFGTNLFFRSVSLPVQASENVIASTVLVPSFVEAPASTGSIVAYSSAVFNPTSVAVIITP